MHTFLHILKIIGYILIILCLIEFICRWIKFKHLPVPTVLRRKWNTTKQNYKALYQDLQQKQGKTLLSLKLKTIIRALCGVKLPTPTATASVSYVTISSLRELPLTSFIKCSVDGDYTCLGDAPSEILDSAWMNLLSLYYEAKEDPQAKKYVKVAGEMAAIELREKMIIAACNGLKAHPSKLRKKSLIELGYAFEYTPESIDTDIERIINKEKVHKVKLQQLKAEYQQMQASNGKGEKQTETAFYETIATMNELWKTNYSVDKMNTLEYCIYIKRLERYIDNQNKK